MSHFFFLIKEVLFSCYLFFWGAPTSASSAAPSATPMTFTPTSFSILDNGLQLFYPFANSTVSGVDIADLATGSADFDASLQNGTAVFTNQLLLSAFTTGQRTLTFSCWFRSSNSGTSVRMFDFGKGPNADNILILRVCLDFSTLSERTTGSLQPETLINGAIWSAGDALLLNGAMWYFRIYERVLSIGEEAFHSSLQNFSSRRRALH